MMSNQNGSLPGPSSDIQTHKRCTICNVPFINPDLITTHYRHHMMPKMCVVVATDEDGNQKYVELNQQQALAYNSGALPIVQSTLGGQQQYILTDQANFKTTTFDGGSQLIAYPQSATSLGTEVEMVHYVDSSGQGLSQEEVQYYALDGQEYSVIQANEEIVVSTEARMPHEEQQLVIEETAVMGAGKAKGGRAAAKRKNSASAEVPKTYSRKGVQPRAAVAISSQASNAPPTKKLLLSDDQTFSVSKVQSLQQHHLQQQDGAQMTAISFVTSGGQTHHVSSGNHLDLQHVTSEQFLSPSAINEEIVVSHGGASKLKSEPNDLREGGTQMATLVQQSGENSYHQGADLKPLGLKVEPHHMSHQHLLQQHQQQQQQQYIVLAYDNDTVIQQMQQGKQPVTVSESYDIKEEKVSV